MVPAVEEEAAVLFLAGVQAGEASVVLPLNSGQVAAVVVAVAAAALLVDQVEAEGELVLRTVESAVLEVAVGWREEREQNDCQEQGTNHPHRHHLDLRAVQTEERLERLLSAVGCFALVARKGSALPLRCFLVTMER